MTSDAAPGVMITVFSRAGPRFERQHDLADVAGDHRVDVILVDGALERAHRLGRGGMVVVGDDLDLAAVDAALGVDLVGGELRGLRDRGAGDRLRLGDHADLDRPLVWGWRVRPASAQRVRCPRRGPPKRLPGLFDPPSTIAAMRYPAKLLAGQCDGSVTLDGKPGPCCATEPAVAHVLRKIGEETLSSRSPARAEPFAIGVQPAR